MTELERDPESSEHVTQRYRELGAEEPPRELDAAILAAARRGAGARPASLDRASRQRWYGPLAAAAVLVLAVAVTLHVQIEQPDLAEPAPRAEKAAPQVAQAPAKPAAEIPKEKTESQVSLPSRARPADKPKAFAQDSAPAASPAPAPAAAPELAAARSAGSPAAAMRDRAERPAMMEMRAKRADEAAETPEKQLERIAELRRAGKHDEADKAIAEFRKRFPDYRIPESMLERVERR